MTDVVQKLWGFCHTMRHDGVDYGDYIEQLTYLLFLKMTDERGIDLSQTSPRTGGRTGKTVSQWDVILSCPGGTPRGTSTVGVMACRWPRTVQPHQLGRISVFRYCL